MAKGQVKVEAYAERLRLRWSYRSKRYCLSIGLPDSIINRKVAAQKAQQIELDMLSGNFDPTLQKYKPEDPLPMVAVGSEKTQTYTDVFKQHWDEFVDDKGQRLESPFTIVGMYNPIPKKVRNFGRKIIGCREAQEFVTFMLQSASPATIKKQVIILNDFGNWVQQHNRVDAGWENPFTGLTEMCHPVPPLKVFPLAKQKLSRLSIPFAAIATTLTTPTMCGSCL